MPLVLEYTAAVHLSADALLFKHIACAAVELKSGKKLDASLVVVGVGAKPNTDLFKGQIDLLEDRPGGVKVICCATVLCGAIQ